MTTPLERARRALDRGRFDHACHAFEEAAASESPTAYAHLGLAAASTASGDPKGALDSTRRALESSEQPEADLVMGAIQSRLENRRRAEQSLQSYLSQTDSSPYGRALLAEQRIRTGRWNEGIRDFSEALTHDPDNRAYRHLQNVCSDLTAAAAEGQIPQTDARKFVNQVEFGLPGDDPSKSQFLSRVRRGLNAGRALSGAGADDPLGEVVSEALAAVGAQRSAPAPRDPPEEGSAPTSGPRNTTPPGGGEGRTDDADDGPERGISPEEKDLAAVIQEDRQRNEGLQDAIGEVAPPDWPSATGADDLDPLPAMAYDRQSIFSDRPDIDSTEFRITSGNVRTEIFLERCLQNLLQSAKRDRAVSIHFEPETITRIEINCLDGLLDDLPETSPIYEEMQDPDQYRSYALGRALGRCVAKPFDGTWDYGETPEETRLVVGDRRLDPIGLARTWLDADDAGDVSLHRLTRRAEKGARMSTSLTIRRSYIDPTRQLEGQSLEMKLAELWTKYLFRLADVSFPDLASTLSLVENGEETVVFTIGREYCPEAARGARGAALVERSIERTDRGGNKPEIAQTERTAPPDSPQVPAVHVGYVRRTGEFLLLGSRPHMARYLRETYGELRDDVAEAIAGDLADYHAPGWFVAADRERARHLAEATGSERVEAPTIVQRDPETELRIWGANEGTLLAFELTHRPDGEIPWSLGVTG